MLPGGQCNNGDVTKLGTISYTMDLPEHSPYAVHKHETMGTCFKVAVVISLCGRNGN